MKRQTESAVARLPARLLTLTLLLFLSLLSAPSPTTAAETRQPRVLIDAAHHNFHTADGRYAPLARLLQESGFAVHSATTALTPELLRTADVLVIANALHASNVDRWESPVAPAFSEAESALITAWVENGGSLLLIADHFPFPGAVDDLAANFGFRLFNGFAIRADVASEDIFDLDVGSLKPHKQITGADLKAPVTRIAAFTGSAFEAPTGAQPLMVLGQDYELWLTSRAWEFQTDTPRRSASGLLQGATHSHGKGRVAVFAEAAMFTSQSAPDGQTSIGFDAPAARDNRAFVVNVFRWLTNPVNRR
jgi:hypothetical protein